MATVSIYIDNPHKSGETIGKYFHCQEFTTTYFLGDNLPNNNTVTSHVKNLAS